MARTWWLCLAVLVAVPVPLQAQYSRPSGAYTLDRISPATAQTMRTRLRSAEPDWDQVLRLFFGAQGYDQGIPDLVIHLPPAGAARLALVHRGRTVKNLEGQTFLYVVVFSERATSASGSAGPHLMVGLRSLETAEDPFLTALVRSLVSQLGGTVPDPELGAGEDSVLELTLRDMRADTCAAEPLNVAMGRIRLGPNTLNRVTITAAEGFSLDPHESLHYMFGNSDGSRFGTSLAGGFTLNVRRPVFDGATLTGTEGYLRSSIYVFGEAYLNRPNLPRDRFSLGLAVGTNLLRGDLLDDLVVGLAIGRLADVGAIVGANSLEWQVPVEGTDRVRDTRRWRAFVGLDFRL